MPTQSDSQDSIQQPATKPESPIDVDLDDGRSNWNVPNALSATRLLMSFVVFGLIVAESFFGALVLFILAASTDWIDGWWARKFNQITKLGRILDPFCDKIIICGTFVLLATKMDAVPWYFSVSGILAVVVIGRELLVTALRSAIESMGGDFSARFTGKLKMVFQCLTAGGGLLYLHRLPSESSGDGGLPMDWLTWFLMINVWLTFIFTIYSGMEYVVAAGKILNPGKQPETG